MIIETGTWDNYIRRLRTINETAASKFKQYLQTHEITDYSARQEAIEYAYALATTYGEGAAELACMMYDEVADASGMLLPGAIPAETATYGEVAKAVQGTMKISSDPELIANAVGRLVKMAGVDTTMQNALRDGAEWAWIPRGETCAFCIALASRGWQRASRDAIKGGHAEHIHANCDCTYAIRFDSKSDVRGYNPQEYLEEYQDADGRKSATKINSMRRKYYEENKDKINAQKRAAYARRKELENE